MKNVARINSGTATSSAVTKTQSIIAGCQTYLCNQRSRFMITGLLLLLLTFGGGIAKSQVCTPYFYYGCTSYDTYTGIISLTGESGSSIADASTCYPNTTDGYYDEYASTSVTMRAGSSYTATLNGGGYYYYYTSAQIWIDLNDNDVFESSESVGGITYFGYYTGTASISIPPSATVGTHRMRVLNDMFGYTYPSLDPCGNDYYGDAKDYKVVIVPPPPVASASPASHDFGNIPLSATSTEQTSSLSASYLTPSSGTFTVTAPANYQVSSDGSTWVSSYTISYSGSAMSSTLHIRFLAPGSTGTYAGNVSVNGGGIASPILVPVTGNAATACTGTPVAGTTLAAPSAGTSATTFSLSLEGTSIGLNFTYQWQSSPDGSSWSNVGGATNSTYSFSGLASSTYYHCIVTCTNSGLSGTSSPLLLSVYCTPYFYYGCSSYDTYTGIVSLSGEAGTSIADVSTCSPNTTDGYYDEYDITSVSMKGGNSYAATINGGSYYYFFTSCQIWIDFNDNGVFESTETVGGIGTFSYYTDVATIAIPLTATPGVHRMRVLNDMFGATYPGLDPCGNDYYGDAKDYQVTIVPPPPSVAATPGSIIFPPTTTGTSSAAIPTSLSGAFLVPAAGTFTVTAPANFQVSSDGITWVTSYTIAYSGSTLPSTTIYVQFNPTASTSYSGDLTVDGGGIATTYTIPLSGIGAPICSGTPTAGSADVSPTSGGGFTPFTLSVTGYSVAGGIQFQWQSSPDGTTWTNISGATLSVYNFTGISFDENYRCIVTCPASGLSSTTGSVMATFAPTPGCTPTSASWNAESSFYALYGASGFSVTGYSGSTLNDVSIQYEIDGSTGYGAAYGIYAPVDMMQNNSYSGSVDWYFTANHQFAQVWIDFDNDGTFAPSEEVTPVSGYSGSTISPTALTLTIPPTASLGIHLMRMRAIWEQNSTDIGGPPAHTDPCLINYGGVDPRYWSGTATDYYANILPAPPAVVAVPASITFPPTTTGTSSAAIPTSLTGSYLVPSSGTFTVTAPANFQVSSDGTTWVSSYTIPYSGGALAATTIYVQFNPTASISYSGDVTVDGGGLASVYNIPVSGIGAPLCTGTPVAGTASVSPSSGSASTPFTLSVTGYTVSGGLGFQWQSSPDGTTWTNIAGATLTTYNFTGITADQYYQCIVTCSASGLSATTNTTMAAFLPVPTCTPTSASWNMESSFYALYGASGFSVTGYSGSTLSDVSIQYEIDGSTGYGAAYGIYAPVDMMQNNSYSGSVDWYFTANHQFAQVWIDFDNDGTFAPSEEVTPVSGYSGSTISPTALTLTIPPTASLGIHLMRMRAIWEQNSTDIGGPPAHTDPCLINYGGVDPRYWSGTATDYYANILPAPPAVVAVPASITFPPTTTGTSSAAIPTSLTGSYLVPSSGTFTVTAPANFQVSSDGTTWVSSYTIPYSGGALAATTIYVQFNPTASISYSGDVTVDGGGLASVYNIPVSGIGAPLCTGTPVAGTASVSPSSGSASTPFTLSVTGYTVSGGLGFQWQSSPDGTTWTNIAGATLTTYNFTGITADQYYQCIVTCSASGLSATTNTTMATFLPVPTCTPTSASWNMESSFYALYGASGFSVTGYSGSTLSDASIQYEIDGSTGYGAAYGIYAPVDMLQNNSYSGSVDWYFTASHQFAQVWIDFDNDGTFAPSEEVTPVTGYSGSTVSPTALTLTIPPTAATGVHLMRMRAIWEQNSTDIGGTPAHTDPCLVNYGGVDPRYWSGTVTDYYANIMTPPPAVAAVPNPIAFPPTTTGGSSAAIPTSLTGSYLVPSVGTLTVTAPADFQVSSDGTTWVTSYTIPYTGSTVPATTVYIQFNPTASTSYSDNVTVDGGGLATVYNILVSGVGAPACTGTPTAGTASVTPSSGSGSTPFTLSVTGYSVAGGVGFQWQSSPDGTSWTNITGATLSTYNFTGISADQYYQCIVTCSYSGLSSTTNTTLATFLPVPACTPTASSWVLESSYYALYGASGFTVNGYSGSTLNDASIQYEIDGSTGYGAAYGIYAPVDMMINNSYSGSVDWYFIAGHQFAQVWIDYNNDGTFSPSEEVTPVSGYASTTSSPTPLTLTIPLTATPGVHLMRMRAIWEQNSTDIGSAPAHMDPCLINYGSSNPNYWSGTVTDYFANLVAPPPVAIATPTALDFGVVALSSTSSPLTTSVTGYFLLPATGTFTVTAPANYLVSSDGSTWVSSYTIPYTGGGLSATTVYVEFVAPGTVGTYSGTVTVDGGGIASPLLITVTGNAADPCTGTPTAGTASASPAAGSSATTFILSLSGTTVAVDLTYQWQSSPDGATWSDVSGETNSTYTFSGLSTSTYYQCIVTCANSGLSETSTSLYIPIYCIPYFYYGCSLYGTYTGILSLTGEAGTSISDASTCAPSTTDGYYDEYSLTSVTLQAGSTYSALINGGSYYYFYTSSQIWIDFNDNGTFESTEVVGGIGVFSYYTESTNITIPSTATIGTHRMRVVNDMFGATYPGIDPCGNDYYGDGKDYKVIIAPPPPVVTAIPNPIVFPPTTTGTSSAAVPTSLTGMYLLPASGTFTVTAPANFLVSDDATTWVTSYTIPYTGSALSATNIYVQFNPTASTSYSGNVTVDGGGIAATYNIVVSGVGAPPCTGTPTPGTAVVSPATGFGATPFTLSVTGYTVAGGIQFQWQSSPDGATWTNITGATLSTYNFTGISQNTYYQCIVTCSYSGLSDVTNSALATFMATPTCTPTAASWTNEDSYYALYGAQGFTVTGYSGSNLDDELIQYEIDASTGYGAAYTTYPAVDMQQNSVYYGAVYWYFAAYYQFAQVWVDFNDDGTFGVSEEVTPVSGYSTSSTSYPTPLNITIPMDAKPGVHLMRMRAIWENIGTDIGGAPAHADPCLNGFGGSNPLYWSGTATDYYTNILCNTPAISGTLSTCYAGGTTMLSDAQSGGVWSSDAPSVAAIGTDGTVTGGVAGTATITYQITATGCMATAVVTINAAPVAITGSGTVCGGSTLTLGESSAGGTWYSLTPAIATVGSTDGVVTGVATGTVTIGYGNGCGPDATTVVTVNAPTVSGVSNICVSTTTTLIGAPSGGTWQSLTPSVAGIDLSSGLVTATATTGTTSIIYTVDGCENTTSPWTETVSSDAPDPISGTGIVCAGATITLSDAVPGGGWSSSNTAVATTAPDGTITGVSAGTANIVYSTGCGSDVSLTVTVNPSPAPITGIFVACVGQTTQLSESTAGVTWGSSASGIASVSGSGLVTGVSAGTALITVTIPATGCFATAPVSVGTTYPSAITITPAASGTVCLGGSAPFTASATYTGTLLNQDFNSGMTGLVGGTWTVLNLGDASPYNWALTAPYDWGDITIAGDGTTYIGTNADLTGSSTILNTSLLSPSFSTVGYTSATLTYNYYCRSDASYDYNAEVDYSLDGGGTWSLLYDYYNTTTGSTSWVASSPDRTISLPGAMLGQPNVMIRFWYYTNYGWYWAVDNVVITGSTAPVYTWAGVGGATGLSCTSCATNTITPTATGVNVYTVYATGGSCYTSTSVTVNVNTISAAPSNDGPACVGGTVQLLSNVGGTATPATYNWSGPGGFTATTSNATLTGVTTAMAGTYNFTVTATGSNCIATGSTNVVINTIGIVAINDGPACEGGTINLSSTPSGSATPDGYSWSGPLSFGAGTQNTLLTSSATTGMAGVYTVTVTSSGSGCSASATTNVVVNTIAVAPSNDGPACLGGTVNLLSNITGTATPTGYSWSGPVGYAAGTADAVLSSITTDMAGTYNFTVTATGSNCVATGSTDVEVSSLGVVAGNDGPACVGGTVNLTAAPSGSPTSYSWSGPDGFTSTDQNPLLTTSATTDMTGTYTVIASNGTCSVTSTTTVTINTLGITAGNTSPACVGGTIDLSASPSGTATPSGYNWDGPLSFGAGTQNPTLTTSATTGMAGTYTVTVTAIGSGCSATATTDVTVNTLSVTADNDGPACVGGTINLSATPGGTASTPTYTWSGPIGFGSTNQNPAVTGLTLAKAGTYTVTINAGVGCTAMATTNVVVQTLFISAANDGPTCIGGNTNLTSTPSGTAAPVSYTWEGPLSFGAGTQNTMLTSVTTAMAGIYTVTVTGAGSGCSATATTNVSIMGLPASISGTASMCVGGTVTVSDATPGGTWSSSNTGIATIGSSGSPRVVTGLFAGTATISYSVGSGCAATLVVTVNPNPVITGLAPICVGAMITLGTDIPGGLWTAQNTKATVGSTSGVVTGVTFGTDNITYTLPTGCRSYVTETINPLPSGIGGSAIVCQGMTTSLNVIGSGGTWSSSNSAVATVGSTGGTTIVTGISAGTATITYVLPTGCLSTRVVTVNPLSPITGNAPMCQGSSITLSDLAVGGTWSSSSPTVATVGSITGFVSGINGGTARISYTTYEGCLAVVVVTVNVTGVITGTPTVCEGGTTILVDGIVGGSWSSSNGNATVGTGAGLVTGVTAGTAVISYTMISSGCSATKVITINTAPSAITGTPTVCAGLTTDLTDAIAGGTWISGSPGQATVGSATGVVTGVTAGTALITYKMTTGGCQATRMVTVYVTPGAITGNVPVCQSSTVTLHDGTAGGSWSTTDVLVGTVSTTGIVTGTGGGTAVITYAMATGCKVTAVVTVNPIAPITGSTPICVGGTVALTDITPGGTWSSSNVTKATVDAGGLVSGIGAGTAKITYLIAATGCRSIITQTVNAVPSAILGTRVVCVGGSAVHLSDATAGGTWSTVAGTGSASVDGSGNVTGTGAGTVTVSYSLVGCGVAATVTVNSAPAAITGNTPVCAGSTLALGESVGGGTWSSTTVSVATVNSSGVVTAVAGGTSTISYTTGAGCNTSVVVTVNTILPITGYTIVCVGATTNLADATPGGTWSSGAPGIASVGTSGVVTGNATGTATISYTAPSGCVRTTTVVVNPLPSPISGTLSLCNGATTTLSDDGSGTWSSTNLPVATISSAGVVSGVSAGTATIKYTSGSGCFASVVVTVNAGPSPIGGASSVCVGSTITLSDFLPGGTWSITSTDATIDGTGHLTGVTGPGTAIVTYTAPTGGCYVTRTFVVNPVPAPISGNTLVCVGGVTFLSDPTPGGITWTSSNTSVATVSASGAVTGVGAGTAIVTYMIGTACTATTIVTVNAVPPAIMGNTPICPGFSITLSDATPGGVWSSSNSAIASIGTDGTVTGVMSGIATITYTVPGGGCRTTTIVTVSTITPITGPSSVCTGSSIALTDASAGGTWSSASGNVTVGPTGSIGGVSAGTAVISYTFAGGGCSALKTVTVNSTPTAINGNSLLCVGTQLALTDGVSGGIWSSGSPTIATVLGSTGVVTGIAAGTSRITYSISGCQAVVIVTVNAAAPVTGLTNICAGGTSNMHNSLVGGVWSSSNPAVGTISASGILTSFIPGTTTVSYSLSSGCVTTATVTVNPVPGPITGNGPVCVGGTLALTDAVTGGTWYSSEGIAVIDASGNVSAIATGTATIIYTSPAGCTVSTVVTVGATPAAISGTLTVCEGSTTLLYDAAIGGVWSSSTGNATVDPMTGIVTGVSAGTTTISYVLAGCGSATAEVTVSASPAAITGNIPVCVGGTLPLGETTTGGVWSSASSHVSVDGSGNVSALTAGTAVVTYTVGSCSATAVVTVAGMPAAITGPSFVCVGGSITLNDATPGGMWSSSDATITIVPGTGVVTGVSTGTASVTYTTATGCIATTTISINTATSPITGFPSVCIGTTTALTDASSGGVWSSSTPAVATVAADGAVTGLATGTTTISYSVGGCLSTMVVTVSSSISGITGLSNVCVGSTIMLSNTTPGGTWSTGSSALSVDGSGNVTGVSAGVGTVTYTAGSGCYVTRTINVNPQPSAINGQLTVCVGATTFLSDGTPGGVSWTSSSTANATISFSGAAVGVAPGTSTITYMVSTGCYITAVLTVNAQPAAISNNSALCQGSSIVLTDATAGGNWSSSNSGIASVGTGGTLTGVAGGVATITYAMTGSGCYATVIATVFAAPNAGTLSGTAAVCAGATTTFSDAITGGVWSSTATGIASVNAFGVVLGVSGGTATISYTVTNSCGSAAATRVVTVNPLPATGTITGTATVCAGSTTALTDLAPGGVWSSGTPVVATVDASGLVTGVAGGTSRISYTVTNGCGTASATLVVTVAPFTGGTIIGSGFVTVGFNITLSDAVTGGVWSASNGNATIGSTGIVTGVTPGTVTISYAVTNACGTAYATSVVTVSASTVSPITGTPGVCVGTTSALTDATPGGTWHSANIFVATVGTSGIVTGVSVGTATISYTVGGIPATVVVTVTAAPSGIGGATSVCVGSTVTLSNFVSGGTWTSTAGVALSPGSASNITAVMGLSSGANTVTYSLGTGCYRTFPITVNPVPLPITGTFSVCIGGTAHVADPTGGGISWTSSTPSVATISASGTITGVSAGTTTITYMISTGCKTTATVTAQACPAPHGHGTTVSGTTSVLTGTSVNIGDEVVGGIWSSSNTDVAVVDAIGLVTGVAPGMANITHVFSYSDGEIGTTVTPVVVNGLPVDVRVVPNPNNGTFTVKGTIGTTADEEVSLEVTDVLGQVIYKSKVTARGGRINETVALSNLLANGMYMLNMHTGTENKVFHFVIEK